MDHLAIEKNDCPSYIRPKLMLFFMSPTNFCTHVCICTTIVHHDFVPQNFKLMLPFFTIRIPTAVLCKYFLKV